MRLAFNGTMDIAQFCRAAIVYLSLSISLLLAANCSAQTSEESYPVPPEAEKQEGVPEGTTHGPFDFQSEIYPGTHRQYWLYVPAQYDKSKPACSIFIQDGIRRATGWRLQQIFDNLIHSGEMPVTIGVFINPGRLPPAMANLTDRNNRSFEYDAVNERYALFLIEEILPEVAKTYNISTDPNDHAIGGLGSGAICAFTVAWHRPDAFRRVLSFIGRGLGCQFSFLLVEHALFRRFQRLLRGFMVGFGLCFGLASNVEFTGQG